MRDLLKKAGVVMFLAGLLLAGLVDERLPVGDMVIRSLYCLLVAAIGLGLVFIPDYLTRERDRVDNLFR